jgi:hypothetical protein
MFSMMSIRAGNVHAKERSFDSNDLIRESDYPAGELARNGLESTCGVAQHSAGGPVTYRSPMELES